MQTIYILIGLPGSGKSTWAIKKVKNNDNIIIVSRDAIRTMFNGIYIYDSCKEAIVKETVRSVFSNLVSYGQYDIIIDETNLSEACRKYWTDSAANSENNFISGSIFVTYVYFEEKNNNLERRMKDPKDQSKEVWNDVIENMKKIFEEISYYENFHNLIYVDKDGNEKNIDKESLKK